MENPVILCESGVSYELSSIERWIEMQGYLFLYRTKDRT